MSQQPRRSPRLFRALLWLLPREFRGDFGDEMAADFADRRRETPSVARLWRRELPALLATAVREHASVLRRDVLYALRLMRRTPGFTALAVLMLAIGTGANVAVFSVIDAVMLRSPFADPDRIVVVRVQDEPGRWTSAVPMERYAALVAAPGPLAAIAGIGGGSHVLTGSGDSRTVELECVSSSMFDVLGTRALLGRTLQPQDDRPGAAPAVVLDSDFWRQLGGRPEIVGSVITLNAGPVTVVGVMPDGFDGPFSRGDADGWLPMTLALSGNQRTGCRAGNSVSLFARLRPALTPAEAQTAWPDLQLVPLGDSTFEEVRRPFQVLAAAVACVLLIACLNVGGLQLERTMARRRELGLRLALGASRGRLVRQTVTESLVLAGCGAAGGVAAAFMTQGWLVSLLPANLPYHDQIAVNGRALAAGLIAALVAGLVAGAIPVLQSRRFTPGVDLNAISRGATRRTDWTRRALVTTQIAVSLVMLIAAGLMIRTFLILRPTSPGFDPRNKLITLVRQPGASPEESARFFDRLFDRVGAIPGVRRAAGSSYYPMSGTVARVAVHADGGSADAFGAAVTSEYFDLMRIPVVAGRGFTTADHAGAPPIAVVNEILARRLRADGAVVGQRVRARAPRRPGAPETAWTIVGVIANTRSLGSDTRARTEFYVPHAQNAISTMWLIADTEPGREMAVASDIRRAVRETDPTLIIEPVDSLLARLYDRVGDQRLGAWLLGLFAAMAVVLAAVGLMTTIGWWVSQRTRELGVRIALGASRAQVTRLVLRQGMTLAAVGIAAGCLAAGWLTRYLEGWIYGVPPLDPATFTAAGVAMLIVAVVATVLPMRRALRVDPVVALRAD